MGLTFSKSQAHCKVHQQALSSLEVPADFNYIGVFLTFACNLRCSYCINRFGALSAARAMLSGAEWVQGLNRILPRPDLPVTLQGGEPTLQPDFYGIVKGLRQELHIDLLTNLEIDTDRFQREISSERLKREAPYASIRVSYHPEKMKPEILAAKVLRLQDAGYSIGIWGVLLPDYMEDVLQAQEYCLARGIDFRTKEFLGLHNGVMHGGYRYPDACAGGEARQVHCRTTELIIGPEGNIYRCHADMYEGRHAIGHILDPELSIDFIFRKCDCYGSCNPCDVKLKTDRFQKFGHTSVEILADDRSQL